MGRKTTPIVLNPVQRRALERKRDAFARAGKQRVADRCRAVQLCADGWELEDIARAVRRPYKTVQEWLRLFRANGLRSVEPKPRSGRPRELGDHERMLLAKSIRRGPRAAGFHGGVWTAPIVADYIKRRWGVEYHVGHVRKLLHKLGFSLQFPRQKLALADVEAQARWMKRTLPRIKKKPANAEQP